MRRNDLLRQYDAWNWPWSPKDRFLNAVKLLFHSIWIAFTAIIGLNYAKNNADSVFLFQYGMWRYIDFVIPRPGLSGENTNCIIQYKNITYGSHDATRIFVAKLFYYTCIWFSKHRFDFQINILQNSKYERFSVKSVVRHTVSNFDFHLHPYPWIFGTITERVWGKKSRIMAGDVTVGT